jgi:hypothetical protein
MATKTLKQITSQLNKADQGTINSIKKRQALIPQELADEEAGLKATQENAFGEILSGARQRGLGFSGIPLGEQAKYTASNFLPAVANLKRSGREKEMSLTDAILGIRSGNAKTALGLYQQEKDRAEQRRQFNLNLQEQRRQAAASRAAASAGSGFSPSLGALLGGGGAQGGYGMKQKAKTRGFAFVGPNGQPISAAMYAAATGTPFRQLLQQMAKKGDVGAKNALSFVGDDFGYDPGRIGNNKSLYDALTWGTR